MKDNRSRRGRGGVPVSGEELVGSIASAIEPHSRRYEIGLLITTCGRRYECVTVHIPHSFHGPVVLKSVTVIL